MKSPLNVHSLVLGVLTVLSAISVSPNAARANNVLLQPGIEAFRSGDYKAALERFRAAGYKQPNDMQTQMWLGLALQADGREWEAMSAWRSGTGNPKWEPIADYLRGLSWWKMRSTRDAINYFQAAEMNIKDGKTVSFPPARESLRRLNAGESAPGIALWPDLSTLSQAGKSAATPATEGAALNKKNAARTAAKKPAVSQKLTSAKQTGARPKVGRWIAAIHNGYKGDSLTFRVSANGNRVENVQFNGHWASRNTSSGFGPEVLRNLDPPSTFAVSGGAFSAVQQVPKSRMWWEFTGRFASATSAEGSYRCAYAGGANDTYKLKWTARYVGP